MAVTLKEQVYNAIWEGIINGKYPADHVFNEKTLVEKFNVSKSPVRDALVGLCSDGVLRSIPRYGYEIVQISNKQLQEIIRLRTLIEVDNLKTVMKYISTEQLACISAHVIATDQMLQENTLEVRGHWENNMAFHKMLYSVSNNQFGSSLLDRCLKAETIAYSVYCLDTVGAQETIDTKEHWAILKCIECNDYDGAVAALQKDLGALTLTY